MNGIGPIIFVVPVTLLLLFSILVIPTIMDSYETLNTEPSCVFDEKVKICKNYGMELGSTVVTPGGLFGGPPYNKEICVGESGERIIEHDEIDWKRCKE